MTKDNKGFSLVELIIVIAIMVLLVGSLAPLLLRFIEKTQVSSDMQLADTVRTAVATAIIDVEVQRDQASQPYLDLMESSTGMIINENSSFLNTQSVLRDSLETAFGFPASEIMDQLRSTHGDSDCIVKTTHGVVTVQFTCTDITANKDTTSATPNNDILVK